MNKMANNNFNRDSVNSKLLVYNNRNLKFYLDGFDVIDFLRVAHFIEMRGGQVVRPDCETVVLSTLDRPPGTKFIRFDINWLADTVNRNELQDIGKYLLPPTTADDVTASDPSQSTQQVPNELNTPQRSYSGHNLHPRMSNPVYSEAALNAATTVTQNGTSPKRREPNDVENDSERSRRSNSPVYSPLYTQRHSDPLDVEDGEEPAANDAAEPREMEAENEERDTADFFMELGPGYGHFMNASEKNDSANSDEVLEASQDEPWIVRRSAKTKRRYSVEENKMMIDYLIENSVILGAASLTTWREFAAKKMIPERSAGSLLQHFRKYLIHHYRKYTNNSRALKDFEKLKNLWERKAGPK